MTNRANWFWWTAGTLGALLAVACAKPASTRASGWHRETAVAYLDARQDWWMSWRSAARGHGTFCVSCHTVLPYALARGTLGTVSSNGGFPIQEERLLDNVRKRTDLWDRIDPYYASDDRAPNRTAQSRGTEAVLNALVLASHDFETAQLSHTTRTAFEHMWSSQLTTGPDAGSWAWLDFGLEPWEAPESQYFGAALGLMAVNVAPEAYRSIPAIQKNIASLQAYLMRLYSRQSLLNRSVLLWAAAADHSVLDSTRRQAIVAALTAAQRSDGGWSTAALMRVPFVASPHRYLRSWINHSGLVDQSSDGYATGLAVIALLKAGKFKHDPVMERAVSWLTLNQDAKRGFWPARSLNGRKTDPYSGTGLFMTDASTAVAALALDQAADADSAAFKGTRDSAPSGQ
jgi:squalene-hopene/tetraprenyl-beta-curcumene cyclase